MRTSRWSNSRFVAVAAACAALIVLAQCKESPTAPAKVATADVAVPLKTTFVPALEGQAFTFPNGGAALSPVLANQTFSLTFSNTSATTPTATVVVTGGGQFVASTTFGSCIFTITTSTIPGVTVGSQITVNPCQVNVRTGGVQATGQATTVQILLQLGITPSAANQASVSIDPNTGIVTVNNVNTGQTVTLTIAT